VVDIEIFNELLEMDNENEGSRTFSRGLVRDYEKQADEMIRSMKEAVKAKNLLSLKQLGYHLKQTSTSLGLPRVSQCCEKIQFLAQQKDEQGINFVERDYAISRCRELLQELDKDREDARTWFVKFYAKAPPRRKSN